MKRLSKILILLMVLAVCLSFPLTVHAHPGRTDGNGGHTDHDTGEYHYHHGYPAHSHYDMDGDGTVDCPYDFDDKSGENSGTSSASNSHKSDSIITEEVHIPTVSKSESKDGTLPQKPSEEAPLMPLWMFFSLLSIILCLLFAISRKNRVISELKDNSNYLNATLSQREEKYKAETKKRDSEQQAAFEQKYAELRKCLSHQSEKEISVLKSQNTFQAQQIDSLSKKNDALQKELNAVITSVSCGTPYFPNAPRPEIPLFRIEVPHDVFFTDDGIPVKGRVSEYKPYGDFTVFVGKTSKVYHSEFICGNAYFLEPVHIYDIIQSKKPCSRCGRFYGSTPPEWYTQTKRILNR